MAINAKQRLWLLGGALALTLAALASIQGNDEPDIALARPGKASVPHPKNRGEAETEMPGDAPLAKLNRQPLPENVQEMFGGKTWHVAPPTAKATATTAPSAPPLPFVYTGKLAEEGERIVVFLNKQGRSYIVRDGDVLDKIYRVDEVRPPVMALTYLPLNVKQTIQIGELD